MAHFADLNEINKKVILNAKYKQKGKMNSINSLI
jgi:hypothetical protein